MPEAALSTAVRTNSSIDEKAKKRFSEAFDELAPRLYRYSLIRVGSKELAEDLVAQTFLQAWQYIQSGREIKAHSPFLYKILRNVTADHWRTKKETVSLDDTLAESFIDHRQLPDVINNDVEMRRVVEALATLPKEHRDILHWRYVDNMPVADITELTGKKRGAIYVTIFRSVQKLKKIFND